jgi:hypothetical protein
MLVNIRDNWRNCLKRLQDTSVILMNVQAIGPEMNIMEEDQIDLNAYYGYEGTGTPK